MNSLVLIFCALFTVVFSETSAASYNRLSWSKQYLERQSCEPLLDPQNNFFEFFRLPNDERQGFVTDAYPLSTASLKAAYTLGLFPAAVTEDGRGKWYSVPQRGVLFFSDLKIPQNDLKYLRRFYEYPSDYRITFNTAFESVIRACAHMDRGKNNQGTPVQTWIAEPFIEAWVQLHKEGLAHSVEVWHGDKLVAGNYGTFINGVYSGESMFHLESNAAKLAYYALLEHLRSHGHTWIDTQMSLGLTKKWGGKLISRGEFTLLLRKTQQQQLEF